MNVSVWDCLADYLGTGQYWRGCGDLSTSFYYASLDYMLNNDTQILLITADELKEVAEQWNKKHPGEIFNLGYFRQNGRFDISLVKM